MVNIKGAKEGVLGLVDRIRPIGYLAEIGKRTVKNEQVQRTINLLQKERYYKNSLMRKVEKLKRDIVYYQRDLIYKEKRLQQMRVHIKNLVPTPQLFKQHKSRTTS